MTAFDKFSELDPAKLLREIDDEIDGGVFDQFSILSPERVRQQLADNGIEMSNYAMLNPALFMSEVQLGLVPAGDEAPEWVPAGAAIFADFVNGQYYYSLMGVVEDPSDLFQSDPDDGDPWEPENIVPGTGYVGVDGAESGLSFIASPEILVGGATFVFEIEDANSSSIHLIAYDAPDFSTFWQAIMAAGTSNSQVSITGTVTDTGFAPTGRAKMAANLSTAGLVASFAGRAVVSDTHGTNFAIINRVTAFLSGDGQAIRTVTAYPLKTDASLPSLSA